MKGKILLIISLGFCVAATGLIPAVAESPAGARVRTMLDQVMAIQTDPQLQGTGHREERRVAIKKIIGENFYFDAMARQSLGPYWEKLSEKERSQFKSIFQDLFQESYTKLVLDFLKREKVVYAEEDLQPGRALIKTTLVRVNEEIPVDYSMTLVQGQWLVEDVTIDGVSVVRNYRQSFTRVIQTESYKSLLQKMRLQQKAIEKPS